MIVKYLESGWEDKNFEKKLQSKIDEQEKNGLNYYDIKISSKGNHCMVIFKPIDKSMIDNKTKSQKEYMKKLPKDYNIKIVGEGILNDNGFIPTGSEVSFTVENQDMWGGDNFGILDFVNGEYVIQTKRSGTITINKGYDAYFNTIKIA